MRCQKLVNHYLIKRSIITTMTKLKNYLILPAISFGFPIIGGCVGYCGRLSGYSLYVSWNGIITPTDVIYLSGESVIMLLCYLGMPCGFLGMIIGIVTGSFMKVRFDHRYRKSTWATE